MTSIKEKEDLILKWREHDDYSLDIVRTPSSSIHIEKGLPSEPPEGVTYMFGPSGYVIEEDDSEYCIIYTEWRNVDNYCHWTFCEIPLMILALESDASVIVFPDAVFYATQSFQLRWLEVLADYAPGKTIVPLSSLDTDVKGIVPINHDTSTSLNLIGKAAYKHYHHSRATPYCIEAVKSVSSFFGTSTECFPKRFYINRKTRRLKNEDAVQAFFKASGFDIVNLDHLTLDQQVQLFAQADFIAGFHGAGLANMIFCEPGTRVLEIVDIESVHPAYKDGVVIPGKKATRTYFHMLAHMKNLPYLSVQSWQYDMDINCLDMAMEEIMEQAS